MSQSCFKAAANSALSCNCLWDWLRKTVIDLPTVVSRVRIPNEREFPVYQLVNQKGKHSRHNRFYSGYRTIRIHSTEGCSALQINGVKNESVKTLVILESIRLHICLEDLSQTVLCTKKRANVDCGVIFTGGGVLLNTYMKSGVEGVLNYAKRAFPAFMHETQEEGRVSWTVWKRWRMTREKKQSREVKMAWK